MTSLKLDTIKENFPHLNIEKIGRTYNVNNHKFPNLTELNDYLTNLTTNTQETIDIMDIFDTEKKEYFTTTKIENKSCIVERLNNDFNKDVNITLINLTQVELLEIASNLSGLNKEEIIKQSVEYMAQKLITLYSKPQEYSEVELRIIETLKSLMYQLKEGILTHITKTRIIQLSFSNPNSVNKFFEKLGILDLVNSKISLEDLFKIYEVLPEVKS
jgi:hypothetical protein